MAQATPSHPQTWQGNWQPGSGHASAATLPSAHAQPYGVHPGAYPVMEPVVVYGAYGQQRRAGGCCYDVDPLSDPPQMRTARSWASALIVTEVLVVLFGSYSFGVGILAALLVLISSSIVACCNKAISAWTAEAWCCIIGGALHLATVIAVLAQNPDWIAAWFLHVLAFIQCAPTAWMSLKVAKESRIMQTQRLPPIGPGIGSGVAVGANGLPPNMVMAYVQPNHMGHPRPHAAEPPLPKGMATV